MIGRGNWITGVPSRDRTHFAEHKGRVAKLTLGEHAAITSRHIIDCTDTVTIERFATVAGFQSQLLTHSIDLELNKQRCAPITIGEYSFVGTASVVLPGAVLPGFSILGAKALLNKKFEEPYVLYGGVPARPIKTLSSELKYFARTHGYVL